MNLELLGANDMFRDPQDTLSFRAYTFTFIDDLGFMPSAEQFLHNLPNAEAFISAAKRRFLQAGWEGDGTLQIMYVPPFTTEGEDGYGYACWHVKQQNNGISYVLSNRPLPFRHKMLKPAS